MNNYKHLFIGIFILLIYYNLCIIFLKNVLILCFFFPLLPLLRNVDLQPCNPQNTSCW